MKWVFLGLLLFIILFFGAIIVNGMSWKEEVAEFRSKCEAQGGQVYIPKGVKGWPEMICFDKDIFITVELGK